MTRLPGLRDTPSAFTERTLDTKTIEVVALAVFRAMFGDEVRVPLKMKGLMDMDLVIQDNNVFLNMNQVQLEVPELLIWRFTFNHRGKPVVEYGRGVKNGVKVHFPQAGLLFLEVWRDKRKKNRAKALADAARDREASTMPVAPAETVV